VWTITVTPQQTLQWQHQQREQRELHPVGTARSRAAEASTMGLQRRRDDDEVVVVVVVVEVEEREAS
jgi:hypothetical protein